MGVGHNRLQWGFVVCCTRFIFLTNHTAVYVVFSEFFHSFAFVGLAQEVGRVRYAGVACKWVIVVKS